jgi:flagellar hook-associated protein 2
MIGNIANSLGFGSGINVSQLVNDLASASRTPKVERFDALTRASQAKISAVAQARADLDSFADTLAGLVAGGSLGSQPTVSNEAALSVSATGGSALGKLSAEIEILALAKAQTSYSALQASAADAAGIGAMTLTVGTANYAISIDASNNRLTGLADAINASGSGVRASIIADQGQVRLVLKGETGAAKAFSLTVDASADPALSRFATNGGMTAAQVASDARLKVDGVEYVRGTNSIADIVPGVSLNLKQATTGQIISLGSTRPGDALKQTVSDFVSVFNQLQASLKDARSNTGSANGLRALDRQLTALASKVLTGNAGINSLNDIGISTTRDGSLSLDNAKLEAALLRDPDAVEALFSQPGSSSQGLPAALDAIRDAAVAPGGSLESLGKALQRESESITKNRERMEVREDAYRARLEKQYGSLDARISALQSTQSYLEQQIKLWSNPQ